MPNSLGCKSQVAWKHVSLREKKYFEHRFPCHNNWSHTMQQPLHGLLPIKRIKFSQASSPSFSSISFPPFLFGTSHEQCPTWMFEKGRQICPLGSCPALSRLGWMNLKVTTVRFHAGSHFLASSGAFSSLSVSLLSGGTSHEQCPTWTIEKVDTICCEGIIAMALASAPAFLNFLNAHQIHVMNHANTWDSFRSECVPSQFMNSHGPSETLEWTTQSRVPSPKPSTSL